MKDTSKLQISDNVEEYLARREQQELLRFVAVGSVDDGKSTLIGRLLHDSDGVYEDQLEAVRRASAAGEDIDFSLFTDGLLAEREQGITIDVAYRYFSTERRKFIIADTPGHVQYTRNMVTGASTANVAVILVDARLGVLQQSKRHAYIASLLGIPHLLVAINKMDLVGWDQTIHRNIQESFSAFAEKLSFRDVTFIPISALKGDNVVQPSTHMPWHQGTVLQYLEEVPISADHNHTDFRYPVQYVIRPNLDYRGFAGQIASGVVRNGDRMIVLPSGIETTVKSIDTFEGSIDIALAPMSVAIRLRDEVDVSRGNMLVHAENLPSVGRTLEAHIVWLAERALDTQKTYILKHTSQTVRVQVEQVLWKIDPDTLAEIPAESFGLNDIGRATIMAHRALYYDSYARNRITGAFILIDSLTNNTVAAGMIVDASPKKELDDALREIRAGSAITPKTQVSPKERRERMGQSGTTIWLTGFPGSGRWTLAYALERKLFDMGRAAHVVDPSNEDLSSIASAARACTDAGLVVICAFQSFKRNDRDLVKTKVGGDRFVEVFVNTSEPLCRERRPNSSFEGFEPPEAPDLAVALDCTPIDDAVELILKALASRSQFTQG